MGSTLITSITIPENKYVRLSSIKEIAEDQFKSFKYIKDWFYIYPCCNKIDEEIPVLSSESFLSGIFWGDVDYYSNKLFIEYVEKNIKEGFKKEIYNILKENTKSFWKEKQKTKNELIKKYNLDNLYFISCYKCEKLHVYKRYRNLESNLPNDPNWKKIKVKHQNCPYCKEYTPSFAKDRCLKCDKYLSYKYQIKNYEDLFDSVVEHTRHIDDKIIYQPYQVNNDDLKILFLISEKLNYKIFISGFSKHSPSCFSIILEKRF